MNRTGTNLLVEGFGRALETDGLAASSRAKYRTHVQDYADWLASEGRHPRDVRRGEARIYLDGVGGGDRVRLAALKKFYGFLRERDMLLDENGRDLQSPFQYLKPGKRDPRQPDPLTAEEDRLLLSAPMTAQERILVYLLRFSGLRISEACGLRVKDVDFVAKTIRVRESKTPAGRRTVPLAEELAPELEVWFAKLKREHGHAFGPELPVLATRNGTPMKAQFAWRILKRAAEKVGVRVGPDGKSTISPHTLRRTYGSALLNAARPLRIEAVSKFLGHSDVRVTQQSYARLLDERAHAEYWEAVGA
jgi:integrase/recombinase XerD